MLVELVCLCGGYDTVIEKADVPQLSVRNVFDQFADYADEKWLRQPRIRVDGKVFYSREEFADMVRTVNRMSQECGGVQVW